MTQSILFYLDRFRQGATKTQGYICTKGILSVTKETKHVIIDLKRNIRNLNA